MTGLMTVLPASVLRRVQGGREGGREGGGGRRLWNKKKDDIMARHRGEVRGGSPTKIHAAAALESHRRATRGGALHCAEGISACASLCACVIAYMHCVASVQSSIEEH